MGRTVFTAEEVRYLESLSVVSNATAARITYTRAFKRDCLRRYLDGENAVDLFREAGLKPEIIGRKRIERCLARWKDERDSILGDLAVGADNPVGTATVAPSAATQAVASSNMSSYSSNQSATSSTATTATASSATGSGLFDGGDVRDRIIVQQTHYIDALEREIAALRQRLQG